MVFSSVPVYLDPPSWHQHQHPNLHQGSGSFDNHQNPQLAQPLPPSPHGGGGSGASSIRPGSMADRARLAKIPQPEVALKCPRCESTNTKFCYFNNYSLSQPRHFCKTCRRYWTRGGALRNVPVGGGCRRNKKNKSSSSKSSTSTEKQARSNSSTSVSPSENIIGLPQPPPQTSFLSSLQSLAQYNNSGNIGVNFGGIQAQMGETSGANQSTDHMGFQNNSGAGLDQWRSQQFPFLASGFESQTGFYSLQSDGVGGGGSSMAGIGENQLRYLMPNFRVSQMAPVKMEQNQGLNSSRQVLGVSENNQFWGGNIWTDLSGLNSSSTSHLL